MTPTTTYRVVGVRADGSKRVLCDGMRSGELAQRIAIGLADDTPFMSIIVERDDVLPDQPPRDGALEFKQ